MHWQQLICFKDKCRKNYLPDQIVKETAIIKKLEDVLFLCQTLPNR